jgi:hypothetical protein
VRRRTRAAQHRCIAGCGRAIEGWQWLCRPCFRRLPFGQRRAIAEAGQAKAPHLVARLAREGAAWLAAHSPAAEAARRLGEPLAEAAE